MWAGCRSRAAVEVPPAAPVGETLQVPFSLAQAQLADQRLNTLQDRYQRSMQARS